STGWTRNPSAKTASCPYPAVPGQNRPSLAGCQRSALARCRSRRIRYEHADGAVLSRRDEELAVAGLADEEIGAGDFRAHFPVDELLQRHIRPVAAGIPLVELHFL